MIDASRAGPYEFVERLSINALASRFQLDHEELQAQWAAWARDRHMFSIVTSGVTAVSRRQSGTPTCAD